MPEITESAFPSCVVPLKWHLGGKHGVEESTSVYDRDLESEGLSNHLKPKPLYKSMILWKHSWLFAQDKTHTSVGNELDLTPCFWLAQHNESYRVTFLFLEGVFINCCKSSLYLWVNTSLLTHEHIQHTHERLLATTALHVRAIVASVILITMRWAVHL